MLSTNSSSSIQQRRKTHRRQQSLEVPLLTQNLGPRRRQPGRQSPAHRRGLSLDQVSNISTSPTGFRPLQPEHQHLYQGPQLDTNTGHRRQPEQHLVQATQQQSLAQPGYQAQDFQSHLHQQLNGLTPNQQPPPPQIDIKPALTPPHQPSDQNQQAELAKLQHHLNWYREHFGASPQSTMPGPAFLNETRFLASEMPGSQQMQMQMMPMQAHPIPQQHMPQTPVSQGQARTVPNTPQHHHQSWPSPPMSNAKHVRSQSFQLDVAPMPDSMASNGLMPPLPFAQANTFNPETSSFVSDHGYASSAYSSSAVDPLSPRPQHPGHMPTLFEEPTTPLPGQQMQGGFDDSSILLQAAAGAQDFNDPSFDFNAPPIMSPRQQLLNGLGPEVPATIVDTGVPAWEVQKYIGELGENDQKYPCLYPGCSRRFGRKENVRAHIQTHLGDRQFKCNLCDKTFVRQHDLKRHVAIHSDDRPFVCPCGTGFARHDALTRHRQRGMCTGALPGFEKSEEEKPKRGRPKKERPDLETRTDKASKQRKKNKDKTADASGSGEELDEHNMVYASSSSGASDRSFPVTPPDTSDAFDADAFLNMANDDVQIDSITSAWRETPPTSPLTGSPTKTVDSVDPTNTNPTFDLHVQQNHDQGISPAVLSDHSSPCPANNQLPAPSKDASGNDFFSCWDSNYAQDSSSFHGGSSPFEGNASGDDGLWDGIMSAQPDVNSGFDAFSPPGESNSSSSTYNYSDHQDMGLFGGKEATSSLALPSGMTGFEDMLMPKSADQERSLAGMLDDWLGSH